MWFVMPAYSVFTKPFEITAEAWRESFRPMPSTLRPQENLTPGLGFPMGKHSDLLVHSAGGYHLIALRKEETVARVRDQELVDEKAGVIEASNTARYDARKRTNSRRSDAELLPPAFSKNRPVRLLCPAGVLVVDPAQKQAEDPGPTLRKSLVALPFALRRWNRRLPLPLRL